MRNEAGAWRTMKTYNVADVALTEMLYWKLLPWIPAIPSHAAHSGETVCPACGSPRLKRRGFAYTAQSQYQRYVCRECGKWSRATTGARTVQVVGVAE